MQQQVIQLPALRVMLGDSARQLLESVLVPLALFYLLLQLVGFGAGLWAAMAWAGAAITRRVVQRRGVPVVLLLTTAMLVGRTVLGLLTGSAFLYFIQPTLQNFLIAFLLLATLAFERPLLARLAGDFCSFPTSLTAHPRMRQFFQRVSMLWALVFAVNGAAALVVLAQATVGNFLLVSTVGSYSLVALAILASIWWFRSAMHGQGVVLRLAPAKPRRF